MSQRFPFSTHLSVENSVVPTDTREWLHCVASQYANHIAVDRLSRWLRTELALSLSGYRRRIDGRTSALRTHLQRRLHTFSRRTPSCQACPAGYISLTSWKLQLAGETIQIRPKQRWIAGSLGTHGRRRLMIPVWEASVAQDWRDPRAEGGFPISISGTG
jgi:hypothetical protein